MARVQGMTPEGIRKLIAEAISFIKDLNVEDLNKLLAAFEDANGIFDVRLVEAQEAVKEAGAKALEAEASARVIIDELAKYEQAQAEEVSRILGEVAVAIDAANLASAKVPGLLARLELAERSISTANAEVEKFITKQDEFLAISQEQVTKVNDLNSGFQELNQAVDESVTKVDEANASLSLVSADLDAAKASLDAKMKQNELNISTAQAAADSNQNAISDLNKDLSGLSTKHETLTSNFSAEVEKLEKADASLLTSMNTKVGELNATTAAQSTAISAAKAQADKGVSDASAASHALANYKTVNDPKVVEAKKDAAKGIEDAAAALTKANTAAGQLPAMNTAISSAAAAAKKANDALPTIRTDISGLTTSIGTATGKLTSLQSDVDSKVADLQAMDQSQAQGITKAQADATKAIGDAKTAADKLPAMVTATSNAAAAAKKANDALPVLSSGISTLTSKLATTTGNLTGLEQNVSSKITALEAMDATQAGEISTAKSQAAKGITDAATAKKVAELAQVKINTLVTKADDLTTGLAGAATQKQYNDLNTRLWGGQGEINTLQGEINANNSAFQTWQTEINGRRDAWEKASTNATKALGELTTEQGKVLAIQTELSQKRDRWESGATLAINNLTDFSTRQTKWNKASTDATKALSDAAAAQKSFNDNQTKWNLASSNATKALADLTTEQGKVLALQAELNTKRDRWESGATLAIDNLTGFATKQTKWNLASSNATKALEDAGKAQLSATSANTTALQGLTAASMLTFPHLNVAPNNSSGTPWWAVGMGVNSTFTPPGAPEGPSYHTSSSSISNVNPEALITVVPGIDYKLEFWTARVDAGSAGAYVDVRNESGNVVLTHWVDVTGGIPTEISWSARNYAGVGLGTSTAWVRRVYLLRVRPGTEKMALHFRPGSTATTNGTRVRFWGAHLSAFMPIQEQIDATQTAALASHVALFEGQNKWNEVANSAIQAQATLLAKQDIWNDGVTKALAWQAQLNNSQSDINRTTKSVLANQEKWNLAQAEINNSQSNTNKAVKSVLDNQDKWNLAQAEINNAQSVTNKAVKLVNDNQLKWNDAVTKSLNSHDELFKTTSKTFKAVKAVTDNQGKWNKVVSDLVTTNTAVSNANKTAIEGLTRVLGLTHSSSNIVPMVPGGVRTGGTDIAPIFTPTPGWMTKGNRVTVAGVPGTTSIDAIQQAGQSTLEFTPYYSEIDPAIEYKYSYWARANVTGTRFYIELRSPEGGGLAVAENKPDNHSTAGTYLAGSVLLAVGWKKYTGTIKFSPDVRSIWIHSVYYNHPNGVAGTQTLGDIQIYPNMPSQTDVNKALTDSDAAQNTLLTKQEDWNDAASRSIATVESLWGKTAEEVGVINALTEELGDKIQQQSDDFAKNITQLFTFIPRIAYAMDGQNVAASETDGFVKITRTKSGSRTTRVAVEAVGRWVGTMIIEGDHGQAGGQDQTFLNLTPIRLKLAVNSATRIFYLNRSTSVDHIGAVKVTFLVDPGQVVVQYPKGTNFTPDKSSWTTLHTQALTAAESTEHNLSLSVTFSGTTYEDTYGVRIRVGSTVVAVLQKSKIGPLFPGQNGTRVMSVQKAQVHIKAGTRIYFEAYSTGRDYPLRRVSKWNSQISYITSGRA